MSQSRYINHNFLPRIYTYKIPSCASFICHDLNYNLTEILLRTHWPHWDHSSEFLWLFLTSYKHIEYLLLTFQDFWCLRHVCISACTSITYGFLPGIYVPVYRYTEPGTIRSSPIGQVMICIYGCNLLTHSTVNKIDIQQYIELFVLTR